MPGKVSKIKVFCDLDGVLTDFDRKLAELLGKPLERGWDWGNDKKIWTQIDNAGEAFWSEMDFMPDGKELWEGLKKYHPTILSSPSSDPSSVAGKKIWLKKFLPGVPSIISLNKERYAEADAVLIDDREKNIRKWKAKGGKGILHKNAASTLSALQKISDEIPKDTAVTASEEDVSSLKKYIDQMEYTRPTQVFKERGKMKPEKIIPPKTQYRRPEEKDWRKHIQASIILRNTANKLITKHLRADFDPLPLPFCPDALEPYISRDQVLTHYIEHHHKYFRKLNDLMDEEEIRAKTLPEIIKESDNDDIIINASQALNHNLYWKSLRDPKTHAEPYGKLTDLIAYSFDDFENLRKKIKEEAGKLKSNGWLWIYYDDGDMGVETTKNSSTIAASTKKKPLLVVDLWEHAYYIDYPGKKDEYIDVVVNHLLNWEYAEDMLVNYMG